jgi:hypothetical protein
MTTVEHIPVVVRANFLRMLPSTDIPVETVGVKRGLYVVDSIANADNPGRQLSEISRTGHTSFVGTGKNLGIAELVFPKSAILAARKTLKERLAVNLSQRIPAQVKA